jgi:hypothetical protein
LDTTGMCSFSLLETSLCSPLRVQTLRQRDVLRLQTACAKTPISLGSPLLL